MRRTWRQAWLRFRGARVSSSRISSYGGEGSCIVLADWLVDEDNEK